jgi:glycolate oxidase FAD binding subunit
MELISPTSPEELAAALAQASAAARPVVPLGAGIHQHLVAPPPPDALRLGTTALDRVLEHVPADLTLTVQAGARLGQVQAVLAGHGQWLPWDPPGGAAATIGGLLACGLAGPLRQAYGTPRDWVLGARIALADGTLVKSGGKVVKNVAGYDLHKLHIGAYGTLGVIVEVTFKLAPQPAAWRTLLAESADLTGALELAARLAATPLAPASVVVCGGGAHYRVAVRFGGVPAAVARQGQYAAGLGATALADAAAAALWQSLSDFGTPPDARPLVRLGIAPQQRDAYHAAIDALGAHDGVYQPTIGAARMLCADLAGLAAARAIVEPLGGAVVVEHGAGDAPRWGAARDSMRLMRALRRRLDPAGVLNPGRAFVD